MRAYPGILHCEFSIFYIELKVTLGRYGGWKGQIIPFPATSKFLYAGKIGDHCKRTHPVLWALESHKGSWQQLMKSSNNMPGETKSIKSSHGRESRHGVQGQIKAGKVHLEAFLCRGQRKTRPLLASVQPCWLKVSPTEIAVGRYPTREPNPCAC